MKITKELLHKVTGVKAGFEFESVCLALSNTAIPDSFTFLDDERYLTQVNENQNINVVLTTPSLEALVNDNKQIITTTDPRFTFYTLLNYIGKTTYKLTPSIVAPSAKIHPTAYIAPHNVSIGENTVIEPNVTILEDVEIGANCIIRAGSVLGAEGFEQKRTLSGILAVFHDGKVIIGNDVHVGALNAISKGFSFRHTMIGDHSRTDNLVHIAHAAQIGKRCLFPASCMIAGSATIADDVWIGPNASVSSGITIGEKAFITIGSVVTKNVEPGAKVTGNFAVPHEDFLRNLKNTLKK